MKVAIYSRKSKFTGKGESTANQIDICKEYLEKHFNIDKFIIYEDEGFSGGNVDRPKFQQMIEAVKMKKIDILICYRLDRISRNISDFSNLIELLDSKEINFISVRERFDTTTPMGRAMMYIASVFAQLERETIAERIKDNMHMLARSGRWLGGNYPTGFKSEPIIYLDSNMKEKKMFQLIPVEEELKTVKLLFKKYLEFESLSKVETYCLQNNIKTRDGNDFQKQTLRFILNNPVYVIADKHIYDFLTAKEADICNSEKEFNGKYGLIGYNKRDVKNNRLRKFNDISSWIIAIGKHKGIISGKEWVKVQQVFSRNKTKTPRRGTSSAALLSGFLRCSKCDSFMRVQYGPFKPNSKKRYHYYACNMKILSKGVRCDCKRVNGTKAEENIIEILRNTITPSIYEKIEEAKKNYKNQGTKNTMILSKIEKSKKTIDALLKQLAGKEDSYAAEYIFKEIDKLAKENKELELQLNQSSNIELFNLDILKDNYINFNQKFDSSSFEEKRNLLKSIVEKIEWDGEEFTINLFDL